MSSKNYLIFFFTFFVSGISYAQTNSADSLLQSLESSEDWEARVSALNQIARNIHTSDVDRAKEYAEMLYQYSRNKNYKKGVAEAAQTLARIYTLERITDSAEFYFNLSIEEAENAEEDYVKGMSMVYLGFMYKNLLFDWDLALSIFYDAVDFFVEKEIKDGEARARTGIAYINIDSGNMAKAIEEFLVVNQLLEGTNFTRMIAINQSNLGFVFSNLNNFEKSAQYYELAGKTAESLDDLPFKYQNNAVLASVYLELGKTEEAENLLNESLEFFKEVGDKENLVEIYYELGNKNLTSRNLDDAERYFKLMTEVDLKIRDFDLNRSVLGRAKVELERSNFKQAIELAESTGAYFLGSSGSVLQKKDYFEILAKAFEGNGDFGNALRNYQSFNAYKDTLQNQENLNLLLIAEAENEFEKERNSFLLERELREVEFEAELRRERLILQGVFLIFIIVAIGSVLLYRNYRQRVKDYHLIKSQNEELEDLNRENKALLAIASHDLKSPLNTIGMMTGIIKEDNIDKEAKNEAISFIENKVKFGLDLIEDLVFMENIEFDRNEVQVESVELTAFMKQQVSPFKNKAEEKGIDLELSLPNEHLTISSNAFYLSRVIDNLISNAVKFTNEGKKIYVSLEKIQEQFLIKVKDEGQGIKKEELKLLFKKFSKLTARPTAGESSTGLGMSITLELLNKLNGSIRVESEWEVGTEFIVSLPAG